MIQQKNFDAKQAFLSLQITESDLIKYPVDLSVAAAVDYDAPRICNLKKYQGDEIQAAAIMYIINFAASLLSVSNTVNLMQQKMLVQRIKTNYFYFNLAELRACFLAGVSGDYGKIYNRLDYQVVCDWLREYDEQRAAALEFKRTNESNAAKKNVPDDERDDDDIIEASLIAMLEKTKLVRERIEAKAAPVKPDKKEYLNLHQYFTDIHLGLPVPPDFHATPDAPRYDEKVAEKYIEYIGSDAQNFADAQMKNISSGKKKNKDSEQQMHNAFVFNFIKTHLISVANGNPDDYLTS